MFDVSGRCERIKEAFWGALSPGVAWLSSGGLRAAVVKGIVLGR